MNIKKTFTQNELRRLLFLTFLGEWVVNAHRRTDLIKREYLAVLHKVLGFAQEMGLDEYILLKKGSNKIGPSSILQEECEEFLMEYEKQFFADVVSDRLPQIEVEALVCCEKMQHVKV